MTNLSSNLISSKKRECHLTLIETKSLYAEMTDADLIMACKQKDHIALEHLLERSEPIVRNTLRRLAPDWKNINDLTQEALIRIWRSIDRLRNVRSFRAWVHHIVTNLFYDELRKRSRQVQVVSMDEPVVSDDDLSQTTRDIVDNSPQPEERLLAGELSNLLQDAMSSIPPNFREAAVLRDVEGFSYEEIAKIMHSELGTVKSRIARARTKIQQRLSPYLRECA